MNLCRGQSTRNPGVSLLEEDDLKKSGWLQPAGASWLNDRA